jgi:acetyl esterase/lipase
MTRSIPFAHRPNVVAISTTALVALLFGACSRETPSADTAIASRLMTPSDLALLPSKAPDKRIAYGPDSSQYGELKLPAGSGPHPVAVLIHGGCFKAAYATAQYLRQMGDALKSKGVGVVDLAGPVDMTAHIREYEGLCGDTVITTLLGGTPSSVPERYAHASPKALLPLGVPQLLVIGTYEEFVPRSLVEAYVTAAVQAGDSARMLFFPEAGHFEVASASASTWPQIEAAIRTLLDGRLPPSGS